MIVVQNTNHRNHFIKKKKQPGVLGCKTEPRARPCKGLKSRICNPPARVYRVCTYTLRVFGPDPPGLLGLGPPSTCGADFPIQPLKKPCEQTHTSGRWRDSTTSHVGLNIKTIFQTHKNTTMLPNDIVMYLKIMSSLRLVKLQLWPQSVLILIWKIISFDFVHIWSLFLWI